jgi:tetratricopeptide (TPR) repeat protein
MRIKPKTLRRLLLLGAFAAVIALGGTGFVLLRQYQNARSTQRLRAEGLASYDRGEYPTAIDDLGRYINRNPKDPDALLAFAHARHRHEESDGRHLSESLAAFKRYLALRPDDKVVLRETLDLYLQSGLLQEAVFYSQRLRPAALKDATVQDLPVLHIEGAALLAMRPPDLEAPNVVGRIAELDPLNVEWNLRYAALLRNLRRTSDVQTLIAAVTKAAPADPRARLIALLAPVDERLDANAKELFPGLCDLAGLSPADAAPIATPSIPDAAYALRLADSFDRIGRFEHSLAVLNAAWGKVQSPELTRTLARRLWQAARPESCINILENIPLSTTGKDIDLLALKALALKQVNRDNDAHEIHSALARRTNEFRARAWADAIAAFEPTATANPIQLERAVSSASTLLPGEPILPFIHAEALASLGRMDEATAQWQAACRSLLSQGWAMPWIRLSQASLQAGDIRAAIEQSTMAVAQAPRSVQAGMARFSALVALAVASQGNRPELSDLISLADAISVAAERLPDPTLATQLREEVGVSRVLLQLRGGQRDAAAHSIREMLNAATPPSRRAMERLALASALEELGLEEDIVALIEKSFGQAPSTAAVRAATLRLAGRKDEGFALLRSGAEGANAPDRLAWDIQIATFLDASSDPAAGPAWIALADENPTNISAQRSALCSPSACRDQAFVDRATQRFAEGTGAGANQELLLRVAKARSMISSDMNPLRRDEVIAALRSVVLDRPSFIDARILLADLLLMSDPARGIQPDPQGAAVELRAAAQASGNPHLRLRAATLEQEQRNFSEARAELLSLWKERKGDAALGRRIAELLVAQGDNADAVPVLRDLVSSTSNPTPDLLLYAGTVMSSTAPDEAAALLTQASENPATRLDQFPEIAAALARLRRTPEAGAALAHLDAEPSPAHRSLLHARFHELTGNFEEATKGYEDATRADPTLFGAWSGLLDARLHANDLDGARRVLDRVTAALPNEPDLRLLRQRVLLASGATDFDDLRVLADLLAANPARASEAQAVRAVDDLRRQNKLDDPESLVALALRFRGSLPVQLLTARRLMLLTPPHANDAGMIAARAMTAFPTDSDSARLCAQIFTAQGRWSQAVSACRAWKDRDPASSIEPDIAIAQAYLALQRPDQAAAQLRPHLPALLASQNRPGHLRALANFARAELAAGKADSVLATLKPLIPTNATLRNEVWLRLAANETPDEATATAWIDLARTSMNPVDLDDQVALASAWSSLAERFPASDHAYARRALDILQPLAAAPQGATAPVLELLGATLQRAGQIEPAIEAFRHAIAADPNRATSLANLAEIFVRRGDHELAIPLIDRALRITQESNPEVELLSASVLHRAGIALFDAGKGEPLLSRAAAIAKRLALHDMGNLSLLAAYAQTAADAGDFPGVIEANSLILDLPTATPAVRNVAKNNLAFGLARARSGLSDLARAETLAREVQDARHDDVSLQTLAVTLSAQGRRDEARTIFSSLLAKSPNDAAVLIAAASNLSGGDESQRKEARELIRGLVDSPEGRPDLPPQDKRDLSRLRGRLVPTSHMTPDP